MDENWKNLEDAEDFAYFRAELVEMSPESYSLEEKRQILEAATSRPSRRRRPRIHLRVRGRSCEHL